VDRRIEATDFYFNFFSAPCLFDISAMKMQKSGGVGVHMTLTTTYYVTRLLNPRGRRLIHHKLTTLSLELSTILIYEYLLQESSNQLKKKHIKF
jgi:hypothetical protein